MTDYEGKYTQLMNVLNVFGTEVAVELEGLSGAAAKAYGDELGEVLDAVSLTVAAASEIRQALKRYERAVAPVAEPERGSSRMYK